MSSVPADGTPHKDARRCRAPAPALLWALLACGSPASEAPAATPPPATAPSAAPRDGPERYHERSWDAVRARALTHLSAQGRDRARARATAGDHAGCAERYAATADELAATSLSEPISARIRNAHVAALRRDAALCAALSRGTAPPVPEGPVAALHATAARARVGLPVPPLPLPRVSVVPTAPTDRAADPSAADDARHALRAALTEAWADMVDPLAPTDPWGYWTPDEAMRAHARAYGRAPSPEAFSVTPAELAAPPTGDTYVDSAGLPGPRAVAPPRVGATAAEERLVDTLVAAGSAGAVDALQRGIGALAAQPDGDRRARAAEAAVLRALARAGAYAEAARVARAWRSERPFEAATIDRQGVVRGIEGRLLVLAADPAADATLADAEERTRAFLGSLPP
jgi:hypothetical protein